DRAACSAAVQRHAARRVPAPAGQTCGGERPPRICPVAPRLLDRTLRFGARRRRSAAQPEQRREEPMMSRRDLLVSGAPRAGGAIIKSNAEAAPAPEGDRDQMRVSDAARLPYTKVVTPNGTTLPWKWKNGAKQFHLPAEPVKREFAPG